MPNLLELRRLGARAARPIALLVLAAALAAAARAADDDEASRPYRFAPHRFVDVQHIKLDLDVDLEERAIAGTAELRLQVGPRRIRTVTLDGTDLTVKSVREKDGAELAFANTGRTIEVTWPELLEPKTEKTIVIDYATRPRMGLNFFGPSKTEPDVPLQVWSQGEPEHNRHWIPSIDHPSERQTTEMVVRAPEGFEVISNGRLVSKESDAKSGKVRWHWSEEVPHTTYLISLVVGQFDVVEDGDWRGKPVVHYVPRGRAKDAPRSFAKTKAMLTFFSDRIGVVYPYEKYAHVVVEQFSAGGMENTSATTLNESTLHDERAHLDFSSDGLVAHELAHQWFGDLITCRDWAHLWLNEGFATYMAALWKEHDLGADEFALSMHGMRGGAMRSGASRPIRDRRYITPREMFDGRAYPKGAWVLHMLRRMVGDEQFWAAIRRYTRDCAGRSVESVELRYAFERETGLNLESYFDQWVNEPGHPVIDLHVRWLEREKVLEVVIEQKQENVFSFRADLGLVRREGEAPERISVPVDEKRERLLIPAAERPVTVCFDDGFAVLRDLDGLSMPRDMTVAALRTYPDAVWRLECARFLGKDGSEPAVAALAAALGSEPFWGVRDAIADALGEAATESAREALLARLAEEKHPKARRAIVSALGKFHGAADVAAALTRLLDAGDASYAVEASAARALAQVGGEGAAKVLLGLLERDSHRDQIRSAALSGLVDLRDPVALQTAIAWSRPGRPYDARRAAIRALGDLAVLPDLSEADQQKAAVALAACLKEPSVRVRRDTINSMRSIGQAGAAVLPVLEGLARGDPDGAVRLAARDAARSARAGEPAHEQIARLRDELKRATEQAERLAGRLDAIEAKVAADEPGSAGGSR